TRLRRDGQHYGCNLIDWHNVENQFRIGRNLALAFQRHEDDWRGGGEAFVPTRERIVFGRFNNARTHDRAHDVSFRSDELFAERLCIRVDVRPTPEVRALNSQFG